MAWAWLHFHAARKRTWKQGVQALRVDWPVYPRRAEHNTVAEGGNRRWAETAPQNAASALNTADCGALCGGAGRREDVERRVLSPKGAVRIWLFFAQSGVRPYDADARQGQPSSRRYS